MHENQNHFTMPHITLSKALAVKTARDGIIAATVLLTSRPVKPSTEATIKSFKRCRPQY